MGRHLRLAVTSLMVLLLTVTLLTGLVVWMLDLKRDIYHRYLGLGTVAVAGIHLYLNRRVLGAEVSTLGRSVAGRTGPRRPSSLETSPAARLSTSRGEGVAALEGVRPKRRAFLAYGLSGLAGFSVAWIVQRLGLPSPGPGQDIGGLYHQWSKPTYVGILTKPMSWGLPPSSVKEYPGAERRPLPEVRPTDLEMPLFGAVERRRSVRDYSRQPMPLAHLSHLLYCAQGVTLPGHSLRAAPSAGALYPIEVYAVIRDVASLPAGVYHYLPHHHAVEQVRSGDFGRPLLVAAIGQEMVMSANVVFVLTSIFQRTKWKYMERAYRYDLLEAGHIAQNIYLAGSALGVGVCAIGAFFDDDVNGILEVDGVDEAALYLVAAGMA